MQSNGLEMLIDNKAFQHKAYPAGPVHIGTLPKGVNVNNFKLQ